MAAAALCTCWSASSLLGCRPVVTHAVVVCHIPCDTSLLQDEGLDDLIADEGDELPSAADLHKVRPTGMLRLGRAGTGGACSERLVPALWLREPETPPLLLLVLQCCFAAAAASPLHQAACRRLPSARSLPYRCGGRFGRRSWRLRVTMSPTPRSWRSTSRSGLATAGACAIISLPDPVSPTRCAALAVPFLSLPAASSPIRNTCFNQCSYASYGYDEEGGDGRPRAVGQQALMPTATDPKVTSWL